MDSIDWIIISKSLDGALDAEESERLAKWLDESDEHRRWYQKVKNYGVYSLEEGKYETWKSEYAALLSQLKCRRRPMVVRRWSIAAWSSAAAFVAIFAFVALLLKDSVTVETNSVSNAPKVQLQLADGNLVDLEGGEKEIVGITHARVSSDERMLTYRRTDSIRPVEYNVLRTKRGGEWNVVLEDGTRVFLNAASTLRYPTSFADDCRQVELVGEAYFEVAHNPERPFIVRTNDMDILVRGTSFNVNAYADYKTTRATLVEGRIEVECSGSTYTVLPGQQVIFEKATKVAKIVEVDTELYASWRDGFYKFNDSRLEDILDMLSLWYDVDVVYVDEALRELRFSSSSKMVRYDSLSNLLKKFEYTDNVVFNLNERNLIVRKK